MLKIHFLGLVVHITWNQSNQLLSLLTFSFALVLEFPDEEHISVGKILNPRGKSSYISREMEKKHCLILRAIPYHETLNRTLTFCQT